MDHAVLNIVYMCVYTQAYGGLGFSSSDELLRVCKLMMLPTNREPESDFAEVWLSRSVYRCFFDHPCFRKMAEGALWDFQVRDRSTGERFNVEQNERIGDIIRSVEDPEVIAIERTEAAVERDESHESDSWTDGTRSVDPGDGGNTGGEVVPCIVLDGSSEGSVAEEYGDDPLPPGVLDYSES